MASLEITIEVGTTWPSDEDLAGRHAVEDALNIGPLLDAGGGRGEMNLAYRIEKDSLPEAREAIRAAMAKFLPNHRYRLAEHD